MTADDLVSLIVADGHGTFGTDLFIGDLPVSPDACVVVTEYGGVPPEAVFGEVTPAIEYPRAQVRVRGEAYDYDVPRTRIEVIYQALAARSAFVVNGTRYLDLSPLQSPFPLGKDENNRWVFAVNFAAEKDRTTQFVAPLGVGASDAIGTKVEN